MGVFVDQQQARFARQGRVKVELQEGPAPMLYRLAGHDLEAAGQQVGIAPAMGLDHADNHVDALVLAAPSLGQHLRRSCCSLGAMPRKTFETAAPRPCEPLRREALPIRIGVDAARQFSCGPGLHAGLGGRFRPPRASSLHGWSSTRLTLAGLASMRAEERDRFVLHGRRSRGSRFRSRRRLAALGDARLPPGRRRRPARCPDRRPEPESGRRRR